MPSGTSAASRSRPSPLDQRHVHGRVAVAQPGVRKPDDPRRGVDARVGQGVALEVEEARARQGLDLVPGEEARRRPASARQLAAAPRRRPRWAAGSAATACGRAPGTRRPSCRSRRSSGCPTLQRLPRPSSKVSDHGPLGRRPRAHQALEVLVGGERHVAVVREVLRACGAKDSGSRLWKTNTGTWPRGSGPPVTNGGIAPSRRSRGTSQASRAWRELPAAPRLSAALSGPRSRQDLVVERLHPVHAARGCRNAAEASRALRGQGSRAGRRRRARAPSARGQRRPGRAAGTSRPGDAVLEHLAAAVDRAWRRSPCPRPWPRTARAACPRRSTRCRRRRWRRAARGRPSRWPAKTTRVGDAERARPARCSGSVRSPSPTIRTRAAGPRGAGRAAAASSR